MTRFAHRWQAHSVPSGREADGLRLHHYIGSNASQRARIALAEKNLSWQDVHVDLAVLGQLDSAHLALNPIAKVPFLVHGAKVVRDSLEVLLYLEDTFPAEAFALTAADEPVMLSWVDKAIEAQAWVGALSYARVLRGVRTYSAMQLADLKARHPNPELVEFLHDYSEDGAAFAKRVAAAEAGLPGVLDTMEAHLASRAWLSGDAYGVADIVWVVNLHRLEACKVALAGWPAVRGWLDRCRARAAFRLGVLEYKPPAA